MTKHDSLTAINALSHECVECNDALTRWLWHSLDRLWSQTYGDMTLGTSAQSLARSRREALDALG